MTSVYPAYTVWRYHGDKLAELVNLKTDHPQRLGRVICLRFGGRWRDGPPISDAEYEDLAKDVRSVLVYRDYPRVFNLGGTGVSVFDIAHGTYEGMSVLARLLQVTVQTMKGEL